MRRSSPLPFRISVPGMLVFILFFSFPTIERQCAGQKALLNSRDTCEVLFYNVENLFDTLNAPNKEDKAFTPDGERKWTYRKFKKKRDHILKTLAAAGDWGFPGIIGLAEIENERVLKALTERSPLKKADYRIIHKDSPDERGIDVALLFQPQKFDLFSKRFIPVRFPDDAPGQRTRDILYAKGGLFEGDTIHIFVNHWPSRYGGKLRTEPKRIRAATILKRFTDSLLSRDHHVNILIMGDFNDTPKDRSIAGTLGARTIAARIEEEHFYRSFEPGLGNPPGTHKYKGEWSYLDQFICSGTLLKGTGGLKKKEPLSRVIDLPFLLKKDEHHFGKKPFRSFRGPVFQNGFSDHLPILMKLYPVR